jgi:hypothetical protein
MAANRNRDEISILFPDIQPAFDDLDVLLSERGREPDAAAMHAFRQALQQLWDADEASEDAPAEPGRNECPFFDMTIASEQGQDEDDDLDHAEDAVVDARLASAAEKQQQDSLRRRENKVADLGQPKTRRRFPDNRFRPNLEDLGPREMSSYPVSPLAAGMAGAASMAVLAIGTNAAASPSLAGCFTHTLSEHRQGIVSTPGGRSTQVLDTYFSSYSQSFLSSAPLSLDQIWADGKHSFGSEESPRLLPEFGAILLLGGLRQDRDVEQRQPCLS